MILTLTFWGHFMHPIAEELRKMNRHIDHLGEELSECRKRLQEDLAEIKDIRSALSASECNDDQAHEGERKSDKT